MDKSALNKIWTIVHLACIYAGVNAILFLQKSPVTLPLFVNIHDEASRGKYSMSVFWVYLAGITLACSVTLALVYLKVHGKDGQGVVSAPVMFGINLHPGTKLAAWYQSFWLVFCLALSVYGVAHATRTALRSELHECGVPMGVEGREFRKGGSVIDGLIPRFGGKDVRFDGCGDIANKEGVFLRGVEYKPFVNDVIPAFIALLDLGLVFAFWFRWFRLFRRPS